MTQDPSRSLEVATELRSVAELRMLHSLAAKLNRLNDVREIAVSIIEELHTLIDYHNCRVFVLEPDGETLLPVAFRGQLLEYQGETFDALLTKVGKGLTGHVAQTARSYYAPDAARDLYATHIPGTPDIDESILAVPLTYNDRVVGVVVLSKVGIDQFDDGDLRLLEVLASHASVAIENARLLQLERESAAKARESEARKTAILESALDCIVAMDHRGIVVEFNPAAETTFGYSREEAMGRELAELIVPPSLRRRHRQGLQRYLSTGSANVLGSRLELTAVRADGSEFPVEATISRVDLSGPPLFTGYIRDISDRKRAEAEIQRALEAERAAAARLRELDAMKNTFLEAVSHDLRTPLAAIMGLALTLEREELKLSSREARELTIRLAVNARKLDRILSNLLDLDRLLHGAAEAKFERASLSDLVRRILGEADFLDQRDVTVDIDRLEADIDPPKVERIVENLLVNAVKHSPPGTPIWVRVAREDGHAAIVVEDAGPGVPEDLRESIFEPFQRGRYDHATPGTGIGLSLVARFTELHGGSVWVQERPGGGASFHVLLPLAADRDPELVPPGPNGAGRQV